MDLTNTQDLKLLLARHGFHFSKSMGQNFLIAPWVPRDIAQAAPLNQDCAVLEIGPGVGSLTRELALRAGKVVAVELDRTLLPILDETLGPYDNVEVIFGDVMKLDLPALISEKFGHLTPHVCANLPYNITTPVLTQLLESSCFHSITVMIQREVARRICALPGDSDRGAFSLLCQYFAQCDLLFEVPPECFLPPPKVTSAVLQLTPHSHPPVDVARETLFGLIRAAFAQRRKTLLNSLFSVYGSRYSKEELRQILSDCALTESIRGERLSMEQFALLAKRLR